MITRIVKLSISIERIQDFQNAFKENYENIASFPGCKDVRLVVDTKNPALHFTISIWESEQAIENYRKSELFNTIWSTVKPWFSEHAQAWSTKSF
jgi:quinol monooxygenase YgiN